MRLGKNIVIYAIADLLGRAIGLITSPITTRLLTQEQYGAAPLLSAVWAVVALAQFGGMDWAYPFFRAQDTDGKQHDGILITATIVATASFFTVWLVFCLAALIGNRLEDYAGVTRLQLGLFLLGLIPATLTSWYLYILRFMHQALPFARVSLLGRVASVVIALPALLLVAQKDRLTMMLAVSLGVQWLAVGWALWELWHIGAWPYLRNLFSPILARKMLRYGLVLLPGGGVYAISAVAGRLLVGWFSGPSQVAIVQLAISLGSVALMLKGWFALVWDPHLVEWISSKNPKMYQPKLQTALLALSVPFFSLACLSAVWSDWVISFLYPLDYAPVARLLPVMILAGACSTLSLVGVATAMIANSPRYHLPIYMGALLVNGTVGIWLIPKLGALGAAVGALASEVWIMLAWMILGKFLLKNLDLDWRFPLAFAGFSGFFVAVYQSSWVRHGQGFLEALLITLVLSVILAPFSWKLWRTLRPNQVGEANPEAGSELSDSTQ